METKLTYGLDEVARILLSHADIHDGEWEIGFDIEGKPSNVTRGDRGTIPGIVLAFSRINLVRKVEKTPLSVTAE